MKIINNGEIKPKYLYEGKCNECGFHAHLTENECVRNYTQDKVFTGLSIDCPTCKNFINVNPL